MYENPFSETKDDFMMPNVGFQVKTFEKSKRLYFSVSITVIQVHLNSIEFLNLIHVTYIMIHPTCHLLHNAR